MTNRPGSDSGGITYAEYLRREIADRAAGVFTDCGPDITDAPTMREAIWPYSRPNYELERELKIRLHQIEPDPTPQANPRADTDIGPAA